MSQKWTLLPRTTRIAILQAILFIASSGLTQAKCMPPPPRLARFLHVPGSSDERSQSSPFHSPLVCQRRK